MELEIETALLIPLDRKIWRQQAAGCKFEQVEKALPVVRCQQGCRMGLRSVSLQEAFHKRLQLNIVRICTLLYVYKVKF